MNITTSRRLFLAKSALVTTGIALLPSEMLTASSLRSPFEGYNPYTEFASDIRKNFFGKELELNGFLYNKEGETVSNAVIEIWHLSPNSKKFRHRSKIRTDNFGAYKLITDFPGRAEAQTARIYFKINSKSESTFTELAIDHSGANITSDHWEKNQHLGKKLFPECRSQMNGLQVKFNLSIN